LVWFLCLWPAYLLRWGASETGKILMKLGRWCFLHTHLNTFGWLAKILRNGERGRVWISYCLCGLSLLLSLVGLLFLTANTLGRTLLS
jgi:hypothetical protein